MLRHWLKFYFSYLRRKIVFSSIYIIGFLGISFLLSSCARQKVHPYLVVPGYSAELIFQENFDKGLHNWLIEGKGKTEIVGGELHVAETSESNGILIWTNREFSGDFQLEYEVDIPETIGMNSVIICAQRIKEENVFTEIPLPTENLDEIVQEKTRSYQISFHSYSLDGQHIPGSKLRKNPGHLLLSYAANDPCQENRRYLIDVAKTGSRIRFFVDGNIVHDVRDKGGFGPIYMKGKTGFFIHGAKGVFTTTLAKIRLFKLSPK